MDADDERAASVALRAANDGDTPYLAAILVRAFQDGYADLLAPEVLAGVTVPVVTDWFRRWRQEAVTVVAGADVPEGFVRFGGADMMSRDDPARADSRVGYIAALYVDPAAAGRGIGRRLLHHAIEELRQQGKETVTIWVFRDNERAKGLYLRSGFLPDGGDLIDPQWAVPQVRLRLQLTGGGHQPKSADEGLGPCLT